MAKDTAAHAVPDMSDHANSRSPKGVRRLTGKKKTQLVADARSAAKKAKARQLELQA